MSMTRRTLGWLAASLLSIAALGAHAQAKAPEALIKEVSTDVLEAVKADKTIQAGDLRKVIALVDQKVLPYVNFQRMTASAVGRRAILPADARSRRCCRTWPRLRRVSRDSMRPRKKRY